MPKVSPAIPSLTAAELAGRPIPQDAQKTILTATHTISFTEKEGDIFVPALRVAKRTWNEPTPPQPFTELTKAKIGEPATFETFARCLQAELVAQVNYLKPSYETLFATLPPPDRLQAAYNQLTGQRIEAFIANIIAVLEDCHLSQADAADTRQQINHIHRTLFRDREIFFDSPRLDTSLLSTQDQPFIAVFEKMRDQLPRTDQRYALLQLTIDNFYTQQYKPAAAVQENNIEVSMNLRAIDAASRCTASVTRESEGRPNPIYCVYQIPPDAKSSKKGAFCYRNGDRYFFDGTNEEVKASKIPNFIIHPVERISLRPLAVGEIPRANFAFARQAASVPDISNIGTSKRPDDISAIISYITADTSGAGDIEEYRSETRQVTQFSRDMQQRSLVALLKFGSTYMEVNGEANTVPRLKKAGSVIFQSGQFNDKPSRLILQTASGTRDFPIYIDQLSFPMNPRLSIDPNAAFSTRFPDSEATRFAANPSVQRSDTSNMNVLRDAEVRIFTGKALGSTFNAEGIAVDEQIPIVYNPFGGEGIMVVGSKITNFERREGVYTYFDVTKEEMYEIPYHFIKGSNGYVRVDGEKTELGRVAGLVIGREMNKETPNSPRLDILENAAKTGEKLFISVPGRDSYQGEITSITLKTAKRTEDGMFERVDVTINGVFGSKELGSVIQRLDENGSVVEVCDLMRSFDIYGKAEPVIAPLLVEGEHSYVNASMSQRGLVPIGELKTATLDVLQTFYDLVYLALESHDRQPRYTIVHDGKRLVYNDQMQWRSDINRIERNARAIADQSGMRVGHSGCMCF